MRIVRFFLESWQNGHDTSPSASLILLSPRVRRRQRIPKMEELMEREDQVGGDGDDEAMMMQLDEKEKAKRKFYWKYRYPPTVKKLTTLCSDVLAKYVDYCIET